MHILIGIALFLLWCVLQSTPAGRARMSAKLGKYNKAFAIFAIVGWLVILSSLWPGPSQP